MSSILPYRVDSWPAPRQAAQPPTVEMAKAEGQCPVVAACASCNSFSKRSPNMPACTSTIIDSAS
jgi:hypothetical protein